MRRTVLVAVPVVAVAIIIGAGYRSMHDGSDNVASVRSSTPESQTIGVFDQFPLTEFNSIEDAERSAGYHIPQPSANFPMAFGKTYLRSFPSEPGKFSTTQYTYTPRAPESIGVTVGPTSPGEADEFTSGGIAAVIGDKNGRLDTSDGAWSFDYRCGSFESEEVWCSVLTSSDIPRDAFNEFVASLQ